MNRYSDRVKELRKYGLSFCDSTVSFKNGQVFETHMAVFGDRHHFVKTRLSFSEIKEILVGTTYL